MSHARARLAVVLAGRRLLAPLTLLAFAVIGVYAYRPNEVQGSFAVTAVLGAIFCAWLVTATERELTPSADAILTVAAGGPARAWRGRLSLVAVFTVAVTVVFLGWPTATDAFDRTPGIADLAAAALAHAACGALGGCLGLVVAPPARAASAFAATIGLALISLALAGTLGPLAGPGAVAEALSAMSNDHVSFAVLAACAVTLAQAAALALAARRLQRWRG